MTCDFAEKFGHTGRTYTIDKISTKGPLDNIGQFQTILFNAWKYQEILTILENILTFLRLSLQLRIERAEISIWRILKNIRQYLTILYNIAQYWAIFGKIWKYLTISSNIVSHLIPQKQSYTIPKFSVPLFFFTWASSRGAFAPKNLIKS